MPNFRFLLKANHQNWFCFVRENCQFRPGLIQIYSSLMFQLRLIVSRLKPNSGAASDWLSLLALASTGQLQHLQ